MDAVTIGDGLILAVTGVLIVFVGLVALIIVILILAAILGQKGKKKEAKTEVKAAAPAPAAPAAPAEVKDETYAAGDVVIDGVPGRTAAMLMAITADQLKVPLASLRFVSIRYIGDE